MSRAHIAAVAACTALAAAGTAVAHLDHPVRGGPPQPTPGGPAMAGGTNAAWEFVTSVRTGNAHSDLDFFTSKGETYVSVGTLAAGPNGGGQTIVRLTDKGAVAPAFVAQHPSASCLSATQSATGLQHDVEATPKGTALPHQPNPSVVTGDVQLLVDATDAAGRCHDNGQLGVSGAPRGGLEIIDVTDPSKPAEIGLTSHIGQAHTVNVDPKRPHIAFAIGQDGVAVDRATGKRNNEVVGGADQFDNDGFELLDLSSCMNFPAGTTIAAKRERCRPQVYRYRYPSAATALSHKYAALQSCHETEIYADDTLACSSITATALFSLKDAFDDRGTPADPSDDRPKGTPLPCAVRPSSSADPTIVTKAMVTDCVTGVRNSTAQPLTVPEWLAIGAPSLEGVRWIGTVPHLGLGATQDLATEDVDATKDVGVAHESELTGSARFVITSDERGGGTVPGGASCTPGADNVRGNGGLHAFPVTSFTTSPPKSLEDAVKLAARDSKGAKALYRAPIRTGPQANFCGAHVFQLIPGQNRLFMGYYSQGTQVVDFVEGPNGTIDFKEAAYWIPAGAETWTSHVFKVQENADGSFTYWGATGDYGRSAIDVYKVTLPAPPKPAGGVQPGTPVFPRSVTTGQDNAAPLAACARTSAFESATAKPSGRGLRFAFTRRGSSAVTVDLFQQSIGRRILGERRIRGFGARRAGFRWSGAGARDGYYIARFRTKAIDGSTDTRRVALVRRGGRFRVAAEFDRREACGLLRSTKLERPVFGGVRNGALSASFRLGADAEVTVEVRRGGKVVKRFAAKRYTAGRTVRLRIAGLPAARGTYIVTFTARSESGQASRTLRARRL